MRVSFNTGDPSRNAHMGRPCVWHVFLDDVELNDVVTADEEAGLIVRVKRGPDGFIQWNRERNELATETVYGRVRITTTRV